MADATHMIGLAWKLLVPSAESWASHYKVWATPLSSPTESASRRLDYWFNSESSLTTRRSSLSRITFSILQHQAPKQFDWPRMPPTSYIDHVVTQAQSNPRMKSLERLIRRKPAHSSKIAIIDYAQNGALGSNDKPAVLENCDIEDLIQKPAADTMRLLLIEDISPQIMIALGEAYDINPTFFAGYVNLHISDKTTDDHSSQSLLTLKSGGEECLHIPYQQILDLGGTKLRHNMKDVLHTDSNTPRGIEHLVSLSGRHLGLAHATCSIMVKKLATYSICLILVDPLVTSAIKTTRAGSRRRCSVKSLEVDFKESELGRSMRSFKISQTSLGGKSMMDNLLHSFQGAAFPGDSDATSHFSDLCRYPISTLIAHWNIYLRLVDRISQHYKHSLDDTGAQLDDGYLMDLIRWRRQISQKHCRLATLSEFVSSQIQEGCDATTWQLLFSDIADLQDQLQDYARLFEGMIILTESMAQHLVPRRSIFDDIYAIPLLRIAILWPMTFFTSFFSMSMHDQSDRQEPWKYISTTLFFLVPAIVLVVQHQEVVQAVDHIYWESIRVYKTAYLRSFTEQEIV